jgi:hypothetical protein
MLWFSFVAASVFLSYGIYTAYPNIFFLEIFHLVLLLYITYDIPVSKCESFDVRKYF